MDLQEWFFVPAPLWVVWWILALPSGQHVYMQYRTWFWYIAAKIHGFFFVVMAVLVAQGRGGSEEITGFSRGRGAIDTQYNVLGSLATSGWYYMGYGGLISAKASAGVSALRKIDSAKFAKDPLQKMMIDVQADTVFRVLLFSGVWHDGKPVRHAGLLRKSGRMMEKGSLLRSEKGIGCGVKVPKVVGRERKLGFTFMPINTGFLVKKKAGQYWVLAVRILVRYFPSESVNGPLDLGVMLESRATAGRRIDVLRVVRVGGWRRACRDPWLFHEWMVVQLALQAVARRVR
ncbi:hypothetical protein B0H10DRAFT_1971898 [Mycena sp. CBHHK59/15]|nr:hypothetical protein B0H10DRAFT_1971898 [Mycena sp. CBHHK59/15]